MCSTCVQFIFGLVGVNFFLVGLSIFPCDQFNDGYMLVLGIVWINFTHKDF